MAITQIKKTRKPQRLMGSASHDVEGSVMYFEYGTVQALDNDVAGTINTGLTNVIIALFQPTNAFAAVGAAASTGLVTLGSNGASNTIAVTTADAGGTAVWNYFLIGTVETP
jgi:hypothetical protein